MGGLTAIRKRLYEKVSDGGWLNSDQETFTSKGSQLMMGGWLNSYQKQVDIIISKNQALEI